ncbi:unnamed protein product [Mycena citricolor]|uniref:Uncharacterized protein n=1 Tax=Mycena citricolor TaxID=2018698 RepID=A0AAD2GYZ6_9AGAR|nr:unnamed protein product [Mycena citricolor]
MRVTRGSARTPDTHLTRIAQKDGRAVLICTSQDISKISKPPPPTASQSSAPKAEFLLPNTREYRDGRLEGSAATSAINERPKVVYSEEDYKIMLCLSVSQFALFRDPGLRRLVHQSTRDGFFPLNVLFTHPCILKYAHEPEMAVVKALRSRGTDIVDVRMNLADSKARGNFEVKPKFWEEGDDACVFTRDDWEGRTVYVENIPVAYRTFPSAVRFVSALLPPGPSIYTRIQGMSIPPHHADDEDTEPTPKPFALITFSEIDEAEALVKAWPWQRDLSRVEESSNAAEAVKFGFRALSKRRWDELNAEYLVYRASLLQTTNSQTTKSDAVIELTNPSNLGKKFHRE